MRVIDGIENYQEDFPLYLVLGNFDGVHLGHRQLILSAVQKAHQNVGKAAAFIFEPHPAQVLFPEKAPKLLVDPESKTALFEKCGLDILIYNPFTLQIASWTPREFVEKILVNSLHVREVFVGFNYSFGSRGSGTPETLQELGRKYGFEVNIISPVMIDEEVVSSSLIRQLLEQGNVKKAFHMLGYLPFLKGTVIQGEQRGSKIGFPTANLGVEANYTIPGNGVYAATATIEGDEKIYKSVVNIGSKPTFHDNYPISIEAHILDYQQDIYGKTVVLRFVDKLRDERRFASLEKLTEQIHLDIQAAVNRLDGQYFS